MRALGPTQRFSEWCGERAFLVRHDIDFDLELALQVAEIEFQEGIQSTFFVLASARTYNLMHKESRNILRNLLDLGHEVGLHFDASIYPEADLAECAKREAEALAFAAGKSVSSLSLHNPSVTGEFPLLDGFVNAYDPRLFSDENYLSDSCFSFRGKNPLEFIHRIREGMVQILLHPMHYAKNTSSYKDILGKSLQTHIEKTHQDFSVNKTYQQQVGHWSELVDRERP